MATTIAPYFTPLLSKSDYTALVRPQTGITILVAHWPNDSTSAALASALTRLLPRRDFAAFNITDAYLFDVYALPELATELDVTFVPTLMWFIDGVMDAVVWHPGVSVEGESVAKGVERVVQRIRGREGVGIEEGSDSDW
ncbi:hypothetical protein BDU57DRAFT_558950 [Ampelomyces quisqualis]|uniref:Thioredoxin domain-containing protein n=1 Tax=Ampelomyces quisqualis TaxID=50730 RepID=A0A6A5QH73_AMPQU|nr:hypothetical protein BDU57DRAFT_558950 [Ampelomyces quisqualis]